MYLKMLCFGDILVSSSDPRLDRLGVVSGITASLNKFAYDVKNFLYVQDLVLASKLKM